MNNRTAAHFLNKAHHCTLVRPTTAPTPDRLREDNKFIEDQFKMPQFLFFFGGGWDIAKLIDALV